VTPSIFNSNALYLHEDVLEVFAETVVRLRLLSRSKSTLTLVTGLAMHAMNFVSRADSESDVQKPNLGTGRGAHE